MAGASTTTSDRSPLGDDGDTALTPKGRRTKAALVAAAAEVFARDGFVDARIADISRTAGLAHGSFYTYFPSKEQIFREVILGVQQDMSAREPSDDRAPHQDPWSVVEAANRRYLRAYRRHAPLMATLEQLAAFNPEFRQLRLDLRELFVRRNSAAIARWQHDGIADPELDPVYAANALGTMVDRFAYTWLVLGKDFDEGLAVETLTRMWLQALGVDHGHHAARPAARAPRSRRAGPRS